jgi:hypothetical protein
MKIYIDWSFFQNRAVEVMASNVKNALKEASKVDQSVAPVAEAAAAEVKVNESVTVPTTTDTTTSTQPSEPVPQVVSPVVPQTVSEAVPEVAPVAASETPQAATPALDAQAAPAESPSASPAQPALESLPALTSVQSSPLIKPPPPAGPPPPSVRVMRRPSIVSVPDSGSPTAASAASNSQRTLSITRRPSMAPNSDATAAAAAASAGPTDGSPAKAAAKSEPVSPSNNATQSQANSGVAVANSEGSSAVNADSSTPKANSDSKSVDSPTDANDSSAAAEKERREAFKKRLQDSQRGSVFTPASAPVATMDVSKLTDEEKAELERKEAFKKSLQSGQRGSVMPTQSNIAAALAAPVEMTDEEKAEKERKEAFKRSLQSGQRASVQVMPTSTAAVDLSEEDKAEKERKEAFKRSLQSGKRNTVAVLPTQSSPVVSAAAELTEDEKAEKERREAFKRSLQSGQRHTVSFGSSAPQSAEKPAQLTEEEQAEKERKEAFKKRLQEGQRGSVVALPGVAALVETSTLTDEEKAEKERKEAFKRNLQSRGSVFGGVGAALIPEQTVAKVEEDDEEEKARKARAEEVRKRLEKQRQSQMFGGRKSLAIVPEQSGESESRASSPAAETTTQTTTETASSQSVVSEPAPAVAAQPELATDPASSSTATSAAALSAEEEKRRKKNAKKKSKRKAKQSNASGGNDSGSDDANENETPSAITAAVAVDSAPVPAESSSEHISAVALAKQKLEEERKRDEEELREIRSRRQKSLDFNVAAMEAERDRRVAAAGALNSIFATNARKMLTGELKTIIQEIEDDPNGDEVQTLVPSKHKPIDDPTKLISKELTSLTAARPKGPSNRRLPSFLLRKSAVISTPEVKQQRIQNEQTVCIDELNVAIKSRDLVQLEEALNKAFFVEESPELKMVATLATRVKSELQKLNQQTETQLMTAISQQSYTLLEQTLATANTIVNPSATLKQAMQTGMYLLDDAMKAEHPAAYAIKKAMDARDYNWLQQAVAYGRTVEITPKLDEYLTSGQTFLMELYSASMLEQAISSRQHESLQKALEYSSQIPSKSSHLQAIETNAKELLKKLDDDAEAEKHAISALALAVASKDLDRIESELLRSSQMHSSDRLSTAITDANNALSTIRSSQAAFAVQLLQATQSRDISALEMVIALSASIPHSAQITEQIGLASALLTDLKQKEADLAITQKTLSAELLEAISSRRIEALEKAVHTASTVAQSPELASLALQAASLLAELHREAQAIQSAQHDLISKLHSAIAARNVSFLQQAIALSAQVHTSTEIEHLLTNAHQLVSELKAEEERKAAAQQAVIDSLQAALQSRSISVLETAIGGTSAAESNDTIASLAARARTMLDQYRSDLNHAITSYQSALASNSIAELRQVMSQVTCEVTSDALSKLQHDATELLSKLLQEENDRHTAQEVMISKLRMALAAHKITNLEAVLNESSSVQSNDDIKSLTDQCLSMLNDLRQQQDNLQALQASIAATLAAAIASRQLSQLDAAITRAAAIESSDKIIDLVQQASGIKSELEISEQSAVSALKSAMGSENITEIENTMSGTISSLWSDRVKKLHDEAVTLIMSMRDKERAEQSAYQTALEALQVAIIARNVSDIEKAILSAVRVKSTPQLMQMTESATVLLVELKKEAEQIRLQQVNCAADLQAALASAKVGDLESAISSAASIVPNDEVAQLLRTARGKVSEIKSAQKSLEQMLRGSIYSRNPREISSALNASFYVTPNDEIKQLLQEANGISKEIEDEKKQQQAKRSAVSKDLQAAMDKRSPDAIEAALTAAASVESDDDLEGLIESANAILSEIRTLQQESIDALQAAIASRAIAQLESAVSRSKSLPGTHRMDLLASEATTLISVLKLEAEQLAARLQQEAEAAEAAQKLLEAEQQRQRQDLESVQANAADCLQAALQSGLLVDLMSAVESVAAVAANATMSVLLVKIQSQITSIKSTQAATLEALLNAISRADINELGDAIARCSSVELNADLEHARGNAQIILNDLVSKKIAEESAQSDAIRMLSSALSESSSSALEAAVAFAGSVQSTEMLEQMIRDANAKIVQIRTAQQAALRGLQLAVSARKIPLLVSAIRVSSSAESFPELASLLPQAKSLLSELMNSVAQKKKFQEQYPVSLVVPFRLSVDAAIAASQSFQSDFALALSQVLGVASEKVELIGHQSESNTLELRLFQDATEADTWPRSGMKKAISKLRKSITSWYSAKSRPALDFVDWSDIPKMTKSELSDSWINYTDEADQAEERLILTDALNRIISNPIASAPCIQELTSAIEEGSVLLSAAGDAELLQKASELLISINTAFQENAPKQETALVMLQSSVSSGDLDALEAALKYAEQVPPTEVINSLLQTAKNLALKQRREVTAALQSLQSAISSQSMSELQSAVAMSTGVSHTQQLVQLRDQAAAMFKQMKDAQDKAISELKFSLYYKQIYAIERALELAKQAPVCDALEQLIADAAVLLSQLHVIQQRAIRDLKSALGIRQLDTLNVALESAAKSCDCPELEALVMKAEAARSELRSAQNACVAALKSSLAAFDVHGIDAAIAASASVCPSAEIESLVSEGRLQVAAFHRVLPIIQHALVGHDIDQLEAAITACAPAIRFSQIMQLVDKARALMQDLQAKRHSAIIALKSALVTRKAFSLHSAIDLARHVTSSGELPDLVRAAQEMITKLESSEAESRQQAELALKQRYEELHRQEADLAFRKNVFDQVRTRGVMSPPSASSRAEPVSPVIVSVDQNRELIVAKLQQVQSKRQTPPSSARPSMLSPSLASPLLATPKAAAPATPSTPAAVVEGHRASVRAAPLPSSPVTQSISSPLQSLSSSARRPTLTEVLQAIPVQARFKLAELQELYGMFSARVQNQQLTGGAASVSSPETQANMLLDVMIEWLLSAQTGLRSRLKNYDASRFAFCVPFL